MGRKLGERPEHVQRQLLPAPPARTAHGRRKCQSECIAILVYWLWTGNLIEPVSFFQMQACLSRERGEKPGKYMLFTGLSARWPCILHGKYGSEFLDYSPKLLRLHARVWATGNRLSVWFKYTCRYSNGMSAFFFLLSSYTDRAP